MSIRDLYTFGQEFIIGSGGNSLTERQIRDLVVQENEADLYIVGTTTMGIKVISQELQTGNLSNSGEALSFGSFPKDKGNFILNALPKTALTKSRIRLNFDPNDSTSIPQKYKKAYYNFGGSVVLEKDSVGVRSFLILASAYYNGTHLYSDILWTDQKSAIALQISLNISQSEFLFDYDLFRKTVSTATKISEQDIQVDLSVRIVQDSGRSLSIFTCVFWLKWLRAA